MKMYSKLLSLALILSCGTALVACDSDTGHKDDDDKKADVAADTSADAAGTPTDATATDAAAPDTAAGDVALADTATAADAAAADASDAADAAPPPADVSETDAAEPPADVTAADAVEPAADASAADSGG